MNRILATMPFESFQGNQYVYDDNTGMVFPASAVLMALLQAHTNQSLEDAVTTLSPQYDQVELIQAANFINRWETAYGAFYRDDSWREMMQKHMFDFSEADLHTLVKQSFRQLVLVLTENCNLRCHYCYFSEAYTLTRNRTFNSLSFETGRKAIDYFFEQARPSIEAHPLRKLAITFYGGEPLMARKTLAKLLAYAQENAPCELVFSLTTNGVLLKGDIAKTLVDFGVAISVSLDGPQVDHDRNRVLPKGHGSFDLIIHNLKEFRQRFPDYKKLSLVGVYDWKTDLSRVLQFYEENKSWLPPLQMLSRVNEQDTVYYDQFTEADMTTFREAHQRLEKLYLDSKLNDNEVPLYARIYFEMRLVSALLRKRHGNISSALLPFTNTCVPGSKLTVRTDGTMDICERVNGTMPIGQVDTGIDFDKVGAIIRDYNQKICLGCWRCPASKLCNNCFALCNTSDGFAKPKGEGSCQSIRTYTRQALKVAYSILEQQPNAFEDLSYFNPELQLLEG